MSFVSDLVAYHLNPSPLKIKARGIKYPEPPKMDGRIYVKISFMVPNVCIVPRSTSNTPHSF